MHQVAVLERDSAPFQVFLVTAMEASSTDDDRLGFGKMGYGPSRSARIVRAACANASVECAEFRMTILRKDSPTTVIAVSAELVVESSSSIARHVYLFDSMKETTVMKCGHTTHTECLHEMLKHEQHQICSKSLIDMTKVWRKLDEEVWILCNDCSDITEVFYHIIGHKSCHCQSCNTCMIAPPVINPSMTGLCSETFRIDEQVKCLW
ncbi:hypothetical protein OPV22_011046 [Ensete ventricosum]|uniref:RCHY1 zinc-ribbon domain-containing protein n=1 Tax=Ensete ventricosum TaxID=4639 RepID=A0AAV8REF5_ENSVE|nr:hypothetical protein OPV22_011046 [Ensete ventricosum]